MADQASTLVGGQAGLTLGPHLRLGGAGYSLLGELQLPRSGSTSLELSMGYGGAVIHYLLARSGRVDAGLGVLAGGGSARIRDPVVGAELGSDNFFVLEPRLTVYAPLRSYLELGLSIRFRVPWGVDDLALLSNQDFRGFAAAFSISLGSFQRP